MKAGLRLGRKALGLALLFGTGMLIAGGVFPLLAKLFPPPRARALRDAVKLRWLRLFARVIRLRINRHGQCIERPALVVGNHVSWLDIIALGQCVPGCFAAKSEIEQWPVIGYLSRAAGTVFIRRGDKKQILRTAEAMAWQLQGQGNMLVFPEGTTTDGSRVLDFHPSLFQPALSVKAAVQPVAIRYRGEAGSTAPFIGDDEFIDHLSKMLKLGSIEAELEFLPAIAVEGLTRNDVSRMAHERICEALAVTDEMRAVEGVSLETRSLLADASI